MGTRRGGRRAAGTRAGGVPRRRLRAGRGGPGRGGAALAGHHLGELLPPPAHGIQPPNGVRVHLAGIDLVRDGEGVLRVLEDNLRVPSGMSYVVENRRTMARVFPGLFLEQQVQPVASYPGRLLDALRRSAPAGVEQPTVVLLTPGVHNSGLFRARLPGPQDGHRAGRGPRPVLPRQRPVHAQHRRAAAGGRRLPARQRRLPRPGALPGRTRWWAARASSTPPGPATSRSPTRSATASPTTS